MSDSKIDPSTGQFIDPMFAVVIAAAVAETVVTWVKGGALPSGFSLCVVSLGYVNLLLSWFGYHKSILHKPIRGSLRFIVTVILLPLYLLTIIMFNHDFIYVALVYCAIFFLWSTWEYFKYIEHNDHKPFLKLQARGYNIIIYISTILLFIVTLLPNEYHKYWYVDNSDWLVFAAITLSVISLRIVKSTGKGDSPVERILAEVRALFFGEERNST